MSNRPNTRPSSRTRAVTNAKNAGKRPSLVMWVVGAVIGLTIIAVVIAALTTKEDTAEGQVQPVGVTGTHLEVLPDGNDDPAVGTPAPALDGLTFSGEPVTLGGASDTPTLAVFVAHWCPHCQAEVPRIVEWQADGTVPEDIRLVAVATSTDPAQPNYPPQPWLEGEDWPGDVLADSEGNDAAAAYGVSGFPFFVAIDADGNVVARGSGELDQQGIEDLVAALESPPA